MSAAKKRKSRSRKKWQSIWVMDSILYPQPVLISKIPQKAMVIIVWDRTRDFILASDVVPESQLHEAYPRVLQQAIENPLVPPPMLPKLLRVPSQAIAKQLRVHFKDFMIEVQKEEEFNRLSKDFLESLDEQPSVLDRKNTETYLRPDFVDGEKFVREYFRLMKQFYETKVWEVFLDRDMLKVSIPEVDLKDVPLIVMGNAEGEYGISLFRNIESLDAFGDMQAMAELAEEGRFGFIGALFNSASNLDPNLRKEVAKHNWPVANLEAYPILNMSVDIAWFSFAPYRLLVSLLDAVFCFSEDAQLRTNKEEVVIYKRKYKLPDAYDVEISFWLENIDDKEAGEGSENTFDELLEPLHSLLSPGCFQEKYDLDNLQDITMISISLDMFLFSIFKEVGKANSKKKFPKLLSNVEHGFDVALNWFVHTCTLDGLRLEEILMNLINKSSFSCPDFFYEWFSAQREAWISLWLVYKIVPEDSGFYALDVITGQTRFIRFLEKQELPLQNCLMLARVLEWRGNVLFNSYHKLLYLRDYDDIIRRALALVPVKKKRPAVSRLQTENFGKKLIELWDQVVAAST